MFQIAIAIAAISVLTRRRPFWIVSLLFGAVGCAFLLLAAMYEVAAIAHLWERSAVSAQNPVPGKWNIPLRST